MGIVKLEDVIDDIAAGPFGSNLKVSSFVDFGFPIIDGANLKGFEVTDNITKFVTKEKAYSLKRSIAKRGDVVVTISGNVGQIAYIPMDSKYEEYLCSQRQFRVTFNKQKVYAPYIVFYFHTREGQSKILSFANQVGVPALSQPLKNFKAITIDLPKFDSQKRIANIVQTFNEKIKINSKINDNLSKQAFALFERLMQESGAREVSLCNYANLNPKRYLRKGTLAKCIDMSELSTKGAFPSGWVVKPFNGGMRFANGDTIMARITPCLENGKAMFANFLSQGETAFGSTEYIVLSPKHGVPPEMLYCLVRYPEFIDFAVKNMNGSSGRQRVSAETIGTFHMPTFEASHLQALGDQLKPIFLEIRKNCLENLALAELRDTLLPKLLSGAVSA